MEKLPNALDGTALAHSIYSRLRTLPVPKRFLAGIVAADDPASNAFQQMKKKAAAELGLDYRIYAVSPGASTDALRRRVRTVAEHATCGGVVVQLPLPAHVNAQYLINVIPVAKDVDVLGRRAREAFAGGYSRVLPPAVGALVAILEEQSLVLRELDVAVVGLGTLVGQPIASYLADRVRSLTLLDKGFDPSLLAYADLVVCGAGAATVAPAMLKEGAGVIDFGYRSTDKGPCGDVDTSDTAALGRLSFYTPTPGGTGPVLIANLLENFYALNRTVS